MNPIRAPRSDRTIALVNGRFVDVEAGRYHEPGVALVIREGRILAMPGLSGEPALTELRIDATYDLDGRAALPGLINTHAHIHLKLPALLLGWSDMKLAKKFAKEQLHKEMADCITRGITTIRDCVTDDLRDTWELRAAIDSGEISGPRILQAVLIGQLGGTWTPQRNLMSRFQNWAAGLPYLDFSSSSSGVLAFDPAASEAMVRDAVDEAIDQRGADLIKIYEQRAAKVTMKPASLMTEAQLHAIVDQARKRGVPTTVHHVHRESFRRALAACPTSLAHIPLDELVTEDDLDRLVESRCALEPTFSGAYGFCWDLPGTAEQHRAALARLDDLRDRTSQSLATEYWIPELRSSVIRGLERAKAGKTKFLGLLDLSPALRFHVGYISIGAENLRRVFDRGVPIGCGNDGGVPPCTVPMVAHELTMLAHVLNADGTTRFSAVDAVRTATIHSAKAMGMDLLLGSLQPGKLADVVVVDGYPLEDLDVLGMPAAAVFKSGELVVNKLGLAL